MKQQSLLLQDMLEWIERIEQFTEGGRAAFFDSELIQQGVIRCYEVIGEIVKRLDPLLLDKHPHIPWTQIAGFRDFLIHRYDRVDMGVIWRAVADDLGDLKTATLSMLTESNRD